MFEPFEKERAGWGELPWWGWLLCVAGVGVGVLILTFATVALGSHLGLARKIAPAAGVACLVSFLGAIWTFWTRLNWGVLADKSFDEEEIRRVKRSIDRLMILGVFLGLVSLSCFFFVFAFLLASDPS